MEKAKIEKNFSYMNPQTGSVAMGADWLRDCEQGVGFDESELESLVEVVWQDG